MQHTLLTVAAWLTAGLVVFGCTSGWAIEDSPTDADLYAVFGVPGGQVFAVGAGGTVLQRLSSGWRELDSGTEEDLRGVWGTSDEHVVVVGDNCAALEYDGELRLVVVSQEPAGDNCPNGGNKIEVGLDANGDGDLDADEVYSTFYECNGADGVEPLPDLRALEVEGCPDFRGIDGYSATAAAAIGGSRIYWYDGQQFSRRVDDPWLAGNLQGVSTPAENDYYVSGEDGVFRWYEYDGESESWHWRRREIGICPVDLVYDCPVALVDDECPEELVGECPMEQMLPILWDIWVGESGQGAVVGTYAGMWRIPAPEEGSWEPLDTGLDGQLRAVHGSADRDETWAVGDNGIVLRQRGDGTHRHSIGTHEDLYGVWVSASGEHVYVVGASGTIGHLIR